MKKPGEITREEKQQILEKLRAFLSEELEHEIGELGAGRLLDFFEEELSFHYYNRGLQDAKAQAIKAFAQLSEDIDFMEKLPSHPGRR